MGSKQRGSYDPYQSYLTSQKRRQSKASRDKLTEYKKPFTLKSPSLTIYCDGGCFPNPGKGGWGFVCVENGDEKSGGVLKTTNNRMELQAVLEVLDYCKKNHPGRVVRIFSDSQYAVRGCNEWRHGWKKKGWTKSGGELKNVDMWKLLDAALEEVNAIFEWVKGHSQNKWNKRADELAETGSGFPPESINKLSFNQENEPAAQTVSVDNSSVAPSSISEIQELWDNGGFTPAFEKAIAEINRLNILLQEKDALYMEYANIVR